MRKNNTNTTEELEETTPVKTKEIDLVEVINNMGAVIARSLGETVSRLTESNMINDNKAKIRFGIVRSHFMVSDTGIIKIKPVPTKVSNRDKIFPDAKFKFTPKIDRMGYILVNMEESTFNSLGIPYDKSFWEGFSINLNGAGKTLDLSKSRDRLELYQLPMLDFIAENKDNVLSHHLFYIENDHEHAKTVIKKKKLIKKANDFLGKLTTNEIIQYCSLYDKNVVSMNAEVAEAFLLDVIDKDPERFIGYCENANRTHAMITLKIAYELGVITSSTFSRNGPFTYGGIPIGNNLEEGSNYLLDPRNQPILLQIRAEINKK